MKTALALGVGVLLFISTIPDNSQVIESPDKDRSIYFKQERDHWLKLKKSNAGISILGIQDNFKPEAQSRNGGLIIKQDNSDLFKPYVAIPVGSWPEAVALGDVNGDGRVDVVMTTSFYFDPENDYKIFVFSQNGYGGLETPKKYDAGDGQSVDIGDLNHDGRSDIVVTGSNNSIGVFLQNEEGTLNPMISYSTTNDPRKVRIGDFNNDGRADVASIAWGGQANGYDVNVFLQNGSGTLDAPAIYTVIQDGFNDLKVGDINHDGLTDIIVMGRQGDTSRVFGVLYQNARGRFDPAEYYGLEAYALGWGLHGIAVGDINGDDLSDIVISYGGNWPNSFIGVYIQNLAGTLNSPISYESYDCPEPVAIGAVNSDQRQDVIVAHGGWNALGVYLQNHDGALRGEELYSIPYASHYNSHGLAIADINSDWKNDVVIADYNHGLVILYGTHSQKFALDLAAERGGTTDPLPGTHLCDAGIELAVKAIPEPMVRFIGWSGDLSGSRNPEIIMMDSDKTVKAHFIQQHRLTLAAGIGGSTSPSPGSYIYDAGTEVAISAVPNPYYQFSHWSGDVSGSENPITFVIRVDVSIMANFIRTIYAPLNFRGQKEVNRSLSQTEYINVLSWQAHPDNVNILKYRIYQIENEKKYLLVELSATTFQYWHRRVKKEKLYTYAICAVNNENREGEYGPITVR